MNQPPPPPSDLLTILDFAALQDISRRSVFTLFQQGLPRVKVPGLGVRIPQAEAQRWLLAGGKQGPRVESAKPQQPLINKTVAKEGEKINTRRMASKSKSYSLSFNQKRAVWIAQVRKAEGGWLTKYLPKSIREHDQLGAEAYLFNWLPSYQRTGQTRQEQIPTNRTISFLAPKWLAYRDNDGRTSPNTHRGFRQALNTWILDNPNFNHVSIQDIDIPTDLGVTVLCRWIDSLGQSPSSKLSQISVLRSLLNDAISMGWIDSELSNPLNKPAILTKEKSLKEEKEGKRVNAYLALEQVITLLTFTNTYMNDFKRMRYLLAVTAGLRDMEIQSLQWKDIDFSAGTIRVNNQLYKRGCLPILDYFEVRKTIGASEIQALPNAISKTPKGDSKRILPLPAITLEALKHWKKVGWQAYTQLSPTQESPVFPRSHTSLRGAEKAGHFTIPVASEGLQTDLERAGIPVTFTDAMGREAPITFHSLRHSYSHLLDSVGASAELIGVLLGHSAKSVGRAIYIPANIEKWRELVDKLPISSVQFTHRLVGKPAKLSLVKEKTA